VDLPSNVNVEKSDAQFENGVQTLTLPKAEEVKPKTIAVKTKKMLGGGKTVRFFTGPFV